MFLFRATVASLSLALLAMPACAQDAPRSTVLQAENVRVEYARVLRAEPVYQTLRATTMVEQCGDQSPAAAGQEEPHGLARVVDAVKNALTPGSPKPKPAEPAEGCRMVPMDREFRRPIAYDVDYVHHGVKYRSRLPYDPGNRLRVRVSVTPIVAGAGAGPAAGGQ